MKKLRKTLNPHSSEMIYLLPEQQDHDSYYRNYNSRGSYGVITNENILSYIETIASFPWIMKSTLI